MAVGDANVFPGFLTQVLTQLSFQSQRLLFSHASADVRGKKKSLPQPGLELTTTRSPLNHPGGPLHMRKNSEIKYFNWLNCERHWSLDTQKKSKSEIFLLRSICADYAVELSRSVSILQSNNWLN